MSDLDVTTAMAATSAWPADGAHSSVRLRPLEPGDFNFLYRLATEGEVGERWRYRGAVPNPQAFADHLWEGVLTQSIVERVADRRRVGLVSAYNANLRDGYVYLAAVSDPELLGTGLCAKGMTAFCDHVLRNWNFRKIYFEATEFNYAQFASGNGIFFDEEARLRDHTFYDGRYWDLVVGSLTRAAWEQRRLEADDRTFGGDDDGLMGLDEFCAAVATALAVSPASVTPDARMIEDLGIDSLGAVIIQDLIERDAGVTDFDLSEGLGTVRDTYVLYLTASSAPPIA